MCLAVLTMNIEERVTKIIVEQLGVKPELKFEISDEMPNGSKNVRDVINCLQKLGPY